MGFEECIRIGKLRRLWRKFVILLGSYESNNEKGSLKFFDRFLDFGFRWICSFGLGIFDPSANVL